jgi:alkylation response protein AidB-like acyl-CoA dehydrogenase
MVKNYRHMFLVLYLAEISRGDAGISTFLWLESCLIGFTVETFGSKDSRKDDILPKLSNLDIIGGWALT